MDTMRTCNKASNAGHISFGEVGMQRRAADVERTHAEFVPSEKTYDSPDGASEGVPAGAVAGIAPAAFPAEGVAAADDQL
jgi:hypothetical protein